VAALKNTRDSSQDFLSSHEQVLLDLARAELPGAQVERNHFVYQGQRFDLSWPLVQANDSAFFRLQTTEHYLAWELVKRAKARPLPDAHLVFDYADLQLTFTFANTQRRHLLALAVSDNGEVLSRENAEHLLCVPARIDSAPVRLDTRVFQPLLEEAVAEQQALTEQQLATYFEQETTKLERWAEDRRQALSLRVQELDEEIRAYKKQARQLASTAEKVQAKKGLRSLERQRDDALSEYHEARKQIEQQEDALLDEISSKLELDTQTTTLFSIRWTLTDHSQVSA
jgi:hypothetical protein